MQFAIPPDALSRDSWAFKRTKLWRFSSSLFKRIYRLMHHHILWWFNTWHCTLMKMSQSTALKGHNQNPRYVEYVGYLGTVWGINRITLTQLKVMTIFSLLSILEIKCSGEKKITQSKRWRSEVLPGAVHSPVLQHSALRSCTSPHSNVEIGLSPCKSVQQGHFDLFQTTASVLVCSCCLFFTFSLLLMCHWQHLTASNALIHPCVLPEHFFHSHFPCTLLQLTQTTLTEPEAHWALTARSLIVVQNPGKHRVLNVSQQHQHLPPHPPCQGCYFQIF